MHEIKVNGRMVHFPRDRISYRQLVELALGVIPKVGQVFSIMYYRGPASKREGILIDGESVSVQSGMVFNVARTGNA